MITKGRTTEAENILKKVAKVNKKNLDDDIALPSKPCDPQMTKTSLSSLCASTKMTCKLLSQAYGWFAATMAFYGLSIASDNLGAGSLYLNFFLATLIELPGSIIAIFVCKKFGRKPAVIYPMFCSGLIMCIVAFIPDQGDWGTVKLVTGLFGKLLAAVAFDSVMTWSIELSPTYIRTMSVGIFMVMSRFGGAAAPWIALGLIPYSKGAPFITMGIITLLGGFIMVWLPETKNLNIDDEEKLPILDYGILPSSVREDSYLQDSWAEIASISFADSLRHRRASFFS